MRSKESLAEQESTWARSSLYFVLSGEPRGFYLGLAAIVAVLAALSLERPAVLRLALLALGGVATVFVLWSVPASPVQAFKARGGALAAVLVLLLVLWGLWIRGQRRPRVSAGEEGRDAMAASSSRRVRWRDDHRQLPRR